MAPPSTDTSTPPTSPGAVSVAVPWMVTGVETGSVAPAAGDVTCEAGAVASADAVAGTSVTSSDAGCAPMSASRLTVACCMSGLGAPPPRSCSPSRPHDHWIVPALKTRAPFARLWKTTECVAVPLPYVEPWSRIRSGTLRVVDERRTSPAGREPLSRSSFHSYPMVSEGPVQTWLPVSWETFGVLRQNRSCESGARSSSG